MGILNKLFGRKPTVYRETSRQAWQSMISENATLDRAIMGALAKAGPEGLICQDIEKLTGRSHQSVSANLRHLVERGFVEPSGMLGATQSGRDAMCWRPSSMAVSPVAA